MEPKTLVMAMLSIGESLLKRNDKNNYNTTYHFFSQCTQPEAMKRIQLNTIHLKQETLQRDTSLLLIQKTQGLSATYFGVG